jgi:Delta3-Delta2-enoyl-CoA isomerase
LSIVKTVKNSEMTVIQGESGHVTYEVRENVAIITLTYPEKFNAMASDEYQDFHEFLQMAAEDPNTTVTIFQSTGKFFSAGANVDPTKGSRSISLGDPDDYIKERRGFMGPFFGRNISLTHLVFNHPKVFVVALNGPVIGLTAAIIAMADLIYSLDSAFFLCPFANLALSAEGATSYTLVQRFGLSLATEALVMSRPIKAQRLKECGFVNKLYPSSQFKSVEEFNSAVYKEIFESFKDLDRSSVLEIKGLLRVHMQDGFNQANTLEALSGLNRFAKGLPQRRFLEVALKQRRHKL